MKRLVSVSHSVCPLAPPFANEQAATTDIEKATALRAFWDVQAIQQRHSNYIRAIERRTPRPTNRRRSVSSARLMKQSAEKCAGPRSMLLIGHRHFSLPIYAGTDMCACSWEKPDVELLPRLDSGLHLSADEKILVAAPFPVDELTGLDSVEKEVGHLKSSQLHELEQWQKTCVETPFCKHDIMGPGYKKSLPSATLAGWHRLLPALWLTRRRRRCSTCTRFGDRQQQPIRFCLRRCAPPPNSAPHSHNPRIYGI